MEACKCSLPGCCSRRISRCGDKKPVESRDDDGFHMDYLVGDIPRFAFGFANPNHAAAMICALFPFLWGWRRVGEKVKGEGVGVQWRVGISFVLSVALVVALAMTFSRTGFVVLALEAAMWWGLRGSDPVEYVALNMSLCVKSLWDILRAK